MIRSMSSTDKAPTESTASTKPTDADAGSAPQAVPEDLVELGRVVGAHGIKGWIKIQPFSSDSEALGATKHWWLRRPDSPLRSSQSNAAQRVNLVWAKPHGANWIACIKDLKDRDDAEALKGQTVLVPRSAFPKLAPDEYYWIDLIGCSVSTDAEGSIEHLGVVESVQDNPAHPILLVRQQTADASGRLVDCLDEKGKPAYSLIPFVSAHVGEIDVRARTIHTHWPRDF